MKTLIETRKDDDGIERESLIAFPDPDNDDLCVRIDGNVRSGRYLFCYEQDGRRVMYCPFGSSSANVARMMAKAFLVERPWLMTIAIVLDVETGEIFIPEVSK